ncbi:MAG: hypothetical protein CVT64_10650 [Actinobacteria bacterium HGW-Actinobacteria-4]|nr:MAG: hypothetical protein CVT64_10650 [Actinobacteria bacterium HGW-Actinobacteria-4]
MKTSPAVPFIAGVLAFVLGVGVAYPLTRAVAGGAQPEPAPEPSPSAVAIADFPETQVQWTSTSGNLVEDGFAFADAAHQSRIEASEAGVTLGEHVWSGGASGSGTEDDDATGGGEGGETGYFFDACAAADPADDCPEGVGGVILGITALPELETRVRARPPVPGDAAGPHVPQCAPVETPANAVVVGIASNLPVTWDHELTRVWVTPGGVRETTVDGLEWEEYHAERTDAMKYDWEMWAADPDTTLDDPRMWIHYCFLVMEFEHGAYRLDLDSASMIDPSETHQARTRFDISGIDGERTRRPTGYYGIGPDQLFVNTTHRALDVTVVHAMPVGLGAGCTTADVASPERAGLVVAEHVETTVIPELARLDINYVYLADHDRSTTRRLDLPSNGAWLVCVYWVDSSVPLSDPAAVTEIEAVRVTPPDAWRPTVSVVGAANMLDRVEGFTVTGVHPGCGSVSVELDGRANVPLGPEHLCELTTGLASMELTGLTFEIEARVRGGEVVRSRVRAPMSFTCGLAECEVPRPQTTLVPLPRITVPAEECGTGFGTGCLSGSSVRSGGDIIVGLEYPGEPLRRDAWSIGDPGPFVEGAAEPDPLRPRVEVEWSSPQASEAHGGRIQVRIRADQPVTGRVSLYSFVEGGVTVPCVVDAPAARRDASSMWVNHDLPELGTSFEFDLDGLCHGARYELGVFLHREFDPDEGLVRAVVYERGFPVGRAIEVQTAPAVVALEATMYWDTEQFPARSFCAGDEHLPVFVEPGTLTVSQVAPDGRTRATRRDFLVSPELSEEVWHPQRARHRPDHLQYMTPRWPGREVFEFASQSSEFDLGAAATLTSEQVRLHVRALAGDVLGCPVSESRVWFEARHTVTVQDLLDGVELRDGPMLVVVQGRMVE